MKITSIECFKGVATTCKINTDEGICGFGEAGVGSSGKSKMTVFTQMQEFAELIIGMDPMNTEEIWDHIHRHTFYGMGGGPVIYSALSALDIACWDIKGKALGVPVYKLLGGKTNSELRCYASQINNGWFPDPSKVRRVLCNAPQDYYDVTKIAISDGYNCVKVDPIMIDSTGSNRRETEGYHIRGAFLHPDLTLITERVAAVREAGGPDLDIIIDAHCLVDANTAVELGRALEPYRIFYLEEPISPMNPELYKEVHHGTRLPLATGERTYTRWGFRPFLEERTLSVIQPDTAIAGGITETKKICDMAHIYDIGVQLHVWGGPIACAAALQIEAVIPNFVIHEVHFAMRMDRCTKTCKYDWRPVNGKISIPELPGIGQELTEEEMANNLKAVVE